MRLLVSLLLVACIAAAWAGCGGGGSDPAQAVTTSSLTKAQFVKQAEAICTQGRLRALQYAPSDDTEQSERDAFTESMQDTLLPALQEVVDEIYELGAPRGEEAQVEALLVSLQKGIDSTEELEQPTFISLEQRLAHAGKLAKKAGLESCVYAEIR